MTKKRIRATFETLSIGVFEKNRQKLFGIGSLTVKNHLFEINQKLHQIFVEAVTFYGKSEDKFELKFKYITPRNLIFYKRVLEVLKTYANDWDFEFIFEKRGRDNFWKQYLSLIQKLFNTCQQ